MSSVVPSLLAGAPLPARTASITDVFDPQIVQILADYFLAHGANCVTPHIYRIEMTKIISYLTARPSRDLVVAAHQKVTREWWDNMIP